MRHRRVWVIAAALVLASSACGRDDGRTTSGGRGDPELSSTAEAAGVRACDDVRETASEGQDHIQQGQPQRYASFPPASGPHDPRPLAAGVYDAELRQGPGAGPTLAMAVHSLEHGYVIAFHDRLTTGELRSLTRRFARERKVIIAPASDLLGKVALVAWQSVQTCRRLDLNAVAAFVREFREKTAPEPNAA